MPWRRKEETKSRTTEFKALFRQRYDFDTNHSERLGFSQSLASFSPLPFISRFSDLDTIKERDLEPCDLLRPLPPETLLCACVLQTVTEQGISGPTLAWFPALQLPPPLLGQKRPRIPARGRPDWPKGSPAPSVGECFRMSM